MTMTRRCALALLSAGAASAGWPGPGIAFSPPPRPWLATDEQIAAETMLLALLPDPRIRAIQAGLRAELAATPRGRIADAARTLDGAIAQWTNSLILSEIVKRPDRPFFLWGTEDSPRTWMGHTLGGVGTSGDNPDAIYRISAIEAGGRYEISGRYHPDGPPTQLLIEVNAGDKAKPRGLMPTATAPGRQADIRSTSQLDDRRIVAAPDGSFRITVGGEADGPNHMALPPSGPCMIGVRDILDDWRGRAASLTIRRLDPAPALPWDIEVVRARVHEDLAGYVRYWANFPNQWFGGLSGNVHSPPQGRAGGWGFVAGVAFRLAPDEGLLVTTARGGAKYTGFQITDPWMIAPDARPRQVCLNGSQTAWNADGTAGFVIAARDPGVANWLDTAGLQEGFAIIRWQAVSPQLTAEGLIRDFRVVRLADIAAMSGLARVTPQQRAATVSARAAAYDTRVN
jgi:hypothetical protein